MALIIKHKLYILLVIVLVGIGYLVITYTAQTQKSNLDTANIENIGNVDVGKLAEAIKKAEAQQPPAIGASPTDEEIYDNSYIKHIRIALNGYLDGSNQGMDDPENVINGSDGLPDCGLNKFDKSYYKSKFVVFHVNPNDYGGVQANIVFINKPDTIFWAWVYGLRGGEEYTLRGFCKNGPTDTTREEFSKAIKEVIESSKFSL